MFKKLDYLIYSPHKTATQSVKASIKGAKYKTSHIHCAYNFKPNEFSNLNDWGCSKEQALKEFLVSIRPKIIYILRDPLERLRSSYFQSYYDDLINCCNFKKEDTPVVKNDVETLFQDFIKRLEEDSLPGKTDSIYELEKILNKNIFSNLENSGDFFYLKDSFLDIVILNFQHIKEKKEKYLSSCLKINIDNFYERNLTCKKEYINKYNAFKEMKVKKELQEKISQRYKKVEDLIEMFNL